MHSELTVRRRCVQSQKPTVDRVEKDELVQLTHIVVDCSSFPYIDLMGVDALARAHNDYKAINITVFFACCKGLVVCMNPSFFSVDLLQFLVGLYKRFEENKIIRLY